MNARTSCAPMTRRCGRPGTRGFVYGLTALCMSLASLAPSAADAQTTISATTPNGYACEWTVPRMALAADRQVILFHCRDGAETPCSERWAEDIIPETSGASVPERVFVCSHQNDPVGAIVIATADFGLREAFAFDQPGDPAEVTLIRALPGATRQFRVQMTNDFPRLVQAQIVGHTSRGLTSLWEGELEYTSDCDAGTYEQGRVELRVGEPEFGTLLTRVLESSSRREVGRVSLFHWSPVAERFEGPTSCPDPAALLAQRSTPEIVGSLAESSAAPQGIATRYEDSEFARLLRARRLRGRGATRYAGYAVARLPSSSGSCPALLVRVVGFEVVAGTVPPVERYAQYGVVDIDPRTRRLRAVEPSIPATDARVVATLGNTPHLDSGFYRDNASGLDMQSGSSPTTQSQADAVAYCASLPLAGGGWRLPTKDELLIVYSNRAALAPTAEFFFWSSSPDGSSPSSGWFVNFYYGVADSTGATDTHRARCVR